MLGLLCPSAPICERRECWEEEEAVRAAAPLQQTVCGAEEKNSSVVNSAGRLRKKEIGASPGEWKAKKMRASTSDRRREREMQASSFTWSFLCFGAAAHSTDPLSFFWSQLKSECAVLPGRYAVGMRDTAITLYPPSVCWCGDAGIWPCAERERKRECNRLTNRYIAEVPLGQDT